MKAKIYFFIVLIVTITILLGIMNKSIQAAASTTSSYTNHLADSFSPYLRQHMHNPVDWYPWGDEALKRAKAENKPILVSIGYSTCYWCHVLEREVFSDEEVAKVMNKDFVNIKVDREVRPDLDEIYMMATQMMTGSGGWPNNLLLTPDLKPFFATTYLPKDQWLDMLAQASSNWQNQRENINTQADQITTALQSYFAGGQPLQITLPAKKLAIEYASSLFQQYDSRYGGFGAGTKFPMETQLLFLLDNARLNNDRQALGIVKNTVDSMIAGGIHDHVGGGFHRYSTEPTWSVPHFEKMLYTQGLMASVLAGLYDQTHAPEYKRALDRLLDYVARDMTDAGGSFYSAEDAETDAVEGAYYVWNDAELKQALGKDDAEFFTSVYETTALPYFPGHKHPDGEVLRRKAGKVDQARIDDLLEKLRQARLKRERPLRDDKIVVAWNGMMIEGFSNAGRILQNPTYVQKAEKAARFILDHMYAEDGKLYRIYMSGKPHQSAFLEDYAWLAKGLMGLYRATSDEQYKQDAIALISAADQFLLDRHSGGYYLTDDSEKLPVRIKQGNDGGALPSGNSVMVSVFADLYAATGDKQWQDKADNTISAFAQDLSAQPSAYGYMIRAMLQMGQPEKSWLQPVTDVKKSVQEIKQEESKDKVTVHAHVRHKESGATHKTVEIEIAIADGWHLNANPASMDFLIPTIADIQTEWASKASINYPAGETLATPLGSIAIYQGTVHLRAVVTADQPIDEEKMRLLLQVQACKGTTCYAPSQITLPVEHSHF